MNMNTAPAGTLNRRYDTLTVFASIFIVRRCDVCREDKQIIPIRISNRS